MTAVPVAVTGVGVLAAALPAAGPAQNVGFGTDQGTDERREQLSQKALLCRHFRFDPGILDGR